MPPLPNYPEFFTRRERALLGARFEELLTPALPIRKRPPAASPSTRLRCAPEAFAAGMDIPLAPSPFCRQAFAVPADFRPGRHPWHHAGVFYAQEPSAAGAARRCWTCGPACGCATCAPPPAAKAASWPPPWPGRGFCWPTSTCPPAPRSCARTWSAWA